MVDTVYKVNDSEYPKRVLSHNCNLTWCYLHTHSYACTEEFNQSGTHRTRQMLVYHIFKIIFRQYPYWPKFLQVIIVTAPVLKQHNLSEGYSIWICPISSGFKNFIASPHKIIKDWSFSVIISQVMGFTLECIVVNHLSSTLSNCPDLGCFNVCHSKMSFTLPLHTTNDQHSSLDFVTS